MRPTLLMNMMVIMVMLVIRTVSAGDCNTQGQDYCVKGTCNDRGRCVCNKDWYGPRCDVHCESACPPAKNLICYPDQVMGNEEDNPVTCECKNDKHLPIDNNNIAEGCYKDPCDKNPCGSRGYCRIKDRKAVCSCDVNYWGDLCQYTCADICPGENLVCVFDVSKPKGENAALCKCKDEFYFPNDENDISKGCREDHCVNTPCGPHGVCVVHADKGHCECNVFFWGEYCDVECNSVCPSYLNLDCVKDATKPQIENAVRCACKDSYENIDPTNIMQGCYNSSWVM